VPSDDDKNSENVKQNGYFELIVRGIGNLQHMRWPIRFAQCHVTWMHCTTPEHSDPVISHPEKQTERERDLNEKRQQDDNN
ncbi:MAG TPA: hypothetical protein VFL49_10115, partial [Pseudolabrys sp.]|nr:hypothetical protein [Pseudolabrys sp.]